MRGGMQNDDFQGNSSVMKNRVGQQEKGGIVKITAKMMNDISNANDNGLEYYGIPITDVCIAGTLIEASALETKLKLKIWDHSGIADVVFFNRSEFESLSEYSEIAQANINKAVKIYGTLKQYKNEKNIQGAKILPIKEFEFLVHLTEVAAEGLHLLGKIPLESDFIDESAQNRSGNNMNVSFNDQNRNQANSFQYNNNNSFNNINRNMSNTNNFQQMGGNFSKNDLIVIDGVREVLNNKGFCLKADLFNLLNKKKLLNFDAEAAIESLCNSGFMCEEDDRLNLYLQG